MNYVDLIDTTPLKRHKTKANLPFHYAHFLAHFKKNHVKAQSVYKTARMSSPSWPLRFLLFCQTKEKSNRGGVRNEMANAQFQLQMSKAVEKHDTAKNAMRDIFSNLTAPNPRLNVIPSLLHLIVDNEAKSRKICEELLATHPQSTQLLRQYAALLLDIYHDEDMADIILQRADQIEEDSTVTLPTATGGTDQQTALQPKDPNAQKDEKTSRMSGASGALIAFAVTWLNKVMQTNEENETLLELMPAGHEEKKIDLLSSMLTGFQLMDQGRHKIIEAALSVFESLKRNEKTEVLLPIIDFLMITNTHRPHERNE
ncbi:hypothetical protein BLNAU_10408 [Blattamonas nauphoetae]|uniref:TmcB/TmcC TPR repeats domain-containing protein n=1 Tax=Blattamonas nauphoetae TaxID=2049346 RepID=A0ABQ9XS67_9EUKA|nr:hypothetical protein BLNAU_10408 [Blattamonas nauphoetae]